MSDSDPGLSDSGPEFESIIATRQRRQNAGSRMRALLQMEEEELLQSAQDNDDDANVALLFAEEGEDEEFEASDDEDEEQEQDEDEDAASDKDDRDNASDSGEAVDADAMLSDSDISASDSDEEEGERELKQQERNVRNKKRKQQRQQRHAVKKVRVESKPKPKAKPAVANIVDSSIGRRQSARQTTLEAGIALQEKLKDEEERKQYVKPVPRKEVVEMTLEERLKEAEITEKENTLSLSMFFEQEDLRKKRQRELQNAKKFKMKEFVRLYSSGVYIYPINEVEYLEEQERLMEIEEGKKNKRKLAYQKRKYTKMIKDAKIKGVPPPQEAIDMLNGGLERMIAEGKDIGGSGMTNEHATEEPEGQDTQLKDEPKDGTKNEIENEGDDAKVDENKDDVKVDENKDDVKVDENKDDVKVGNEQKELEEDSKEEEPKEEDSKEEEPKEEDSKEEEPKEEDSKEEEPKEENGSVVTDSEKKQPEPTTSPTPNAEGEDDDEDGDKEVADKRVFEGPPQLSAYQYVSFEEFRKPVSLEFMQSALLGPQSLLTSRNDPHYETLQLIRADYSSSIDLKKIQDERNHQFELLMKLPKFGEKYQNVISMDEEENMDGLEVKIRTPLPVGISLANGQRKKCLIGGTQATYYDPNNGLPYANVECFKILKDITENGYSWVQLDNGGVNSRYKFGVGCYLNDLNLEPAKGVPEGF